MPPRGPERLLRWYLHRDPKVVTGVLRVFLRALSTTMRKYSPDAPREAKMGAVSLFHRGGSSLNVHPHFHNVIADGVFALNKGQVYQFQRPLPDGRTHEILSVMDLMKRLAELIPPPWMHQRYRKRR